MCKKTILRLLTIIFTFDAFVFAGSILNPGFENVIAGTKFDTPANWNVENYASVVSVFEPTLSKYPGNKSLWKIDIHAGLPAYEGTKFALLSNGPGDIYFGKMTQNITVNAGDVISGVYFFGTCDSGTYYDYASIKLLAQPGSGLSNIELVSVSLTSVGDFGSTNGWQAFQSNPLPYSGTYTLECGVFDFKDSINESYFAVDAIHITSIPEPASLLLLAGGFFLYRRK